MGSVALPPFAASVELVGEPVEDLTASFNGQPVFASRCVEQRFVSGDFTPVFEVCPTTVKQDYSSFLGAAPVVSNRQMTLRVIHQPLPAPTPVAKLHTSAPVMAFRA